MGAILFTSGVWALGADLIYGSKAAASEYAFGLFLLQGSSLMFTVVFILTIYLLITRMIAAFMPFMMRDLMREEELKKKKIKKQ